MREYVVYVLAAIPVVVVLILIWMWVRGRRRGKTEKKKIAYQGVVKRDWIATGRIDFATDEESNASEAERPAEFKLLVEERRIVQSIAGNENLEIQWRLASLKEAKVVIAQYHQFLGEHGLIKAMFEDQPAAAPARAATAAPAPAPKPAPEPKPAAVAAAAPKPTPAPEPARTAPVAPAPEAAPAPTPTPAPEPAAATPPLQPNAEAAPAEAERKPAAEPAVAASGTS